MGGSQEYSTYSLGRRFKVPQGIFERLTQGYIQGQTKGQKPRGRRPQGFFAFGLVEDVPEGLPLENPEGGLEYSPREYVGYIRDLPRAPFTMIPPRLSYIFLLLADPGKARGCSINSLVIH